MNSDVLFKQCALVVVAAGKGTRFGGVKQFTELNGKPVLAHCLDNLSRLYFLEKIVVLPTDYLDSVEWKTIQDTSNIVVSKTVSGGNERVDSVLNGIQAVSEGIPYVAIHDGARPFPPLNCCKEALVKLDMEAELSSVIIASPVYQTLKEVSVTGRIQRTHPRTSFALAETPQFCRLAEIKGVLQNFHFQRPPTDEAEALEMAGRKTSVLIHDGWNPKITTPQDLELAEAWMKSRENKS